MVQDLVHSGWDRDPFATGRPEPSAIRAAGREVIGTGAQRGPDGFPLPALQSLPLAVSHRESSPFTGNLGFPTELLGAFEEFGRGMGG